MGFRNTQVGFAGHIKNNVLTKYPHLVLRIQLLKEMSPMSAISFSLRIFMSVIT